MGTPRSLSAQNDVTSMQTKMKLTGYHTRTMFQLKGSTLMMPNVLKACTKTTQSAHWKKSSASGALKLNEDRAALFKMVCNETKCDGISTVWTSK